MGSEQNTRQRKSVCRIRKIVKATALCRAVAFLSPQPRPVLLLPRHPEPQAKDLLRTAKPSLFVNS